MITPGEVKRAKQKAVGGKRDKCRKGKSCSATCISGWKACLVEMPDLISENLKKAKESIKGKVIDSLPGVKGERLRERRRSYLESRKLLVHKIHRATMGGEYSKADSLRGRLEKLERDIGAKLGVKQTKSPDAQGSTRYLQRWNNYFRAKNSLRGKMKVEALKGDRAAYDKLEKRLLALEGKGGKLFSDKQLNQKGDLWSSYRRAPREQSYKSIIARIKDRMYTAAKNGDRKEYLKLQRTFQMIQNKAGRKLGVVGPEGAKKDEETWRKARLEIARETLKGKIMGAIASDNRAAYDKLAAKLVNIGGSVGSDRQGQMWDNYQGLAHFVSRLDKSDLKNGREGVTGIKMITNASPFGGQMLTVQSYVLGNKLELKVSPDSLSFTVNDSYLATGTLSRREEVALIRETRRQFDVISKYIGEGTALEVSAAEGDNRKEMRQRGYRDYGFSAPDRRGQMFGIVRDGKIEPIDEDSYYAQARNRFSKT